MTPTSRLKICGLLFFALAMELGAQQGFNHQKSFSSGFTSFRNIVSHGDTISIVGIVRDTPASAFTQNILFVQMDTLGNLLNHRTFKDSLGDDYILSLGNGLVRTKDGGFVFVGNPFDRFGGFIMKLSNSGDLVFYKEHTAADTYITIQTGLAEVDDGFLISGTRQKSDLTVGAYLLKTTPEGDSLWDKTFVYSGVRTFGESLCTNKNNTAVLAGFLEFTQPRAYQSVIITVDSEGNKIADFRGPKNKESYAVGIASTPEGGLVYGVGSYEPIDPAEFASNIRLVCRDSNMNLLWEIYPAPTDYYTNTFYDVKPTPDGNWVALGSWAPPYVPNSGVAGYRGGSLTKFTAAGDTLWNRLFTPFANPAGTINELGGMAVLPSGSIVAVGESHYFYPNATNYVGWVIKISPDGCVDTLLCATSPAREPLAETAGPSFRVSPNPSTGLFQISVQNVPANPLNFKVFDAAGRLVRSELTGSTGTAFSQTLDLTDLPAGLYLLQITDGQSVGALRLAKF